MIEKMKKITIICMSSERQKAIQAMEKLASIHIVSVKAPVSQEMDKLQDVNNRLKSLTRSLGLIKVSDKASSSKPATIQEFEKAAALLAEQKAASERCIQLGKAIKELAPWGTFSEASLQNLRDHGWNVALCLCDEDKVPSIPESASYQEIKREDKMVYFVVLSEASLEEVSLPLAKFPLGMELDKLQSEKQQLEDRSREIESLLKKIVSEKLCGLKLLQKSEENKLAFAKARDGMGDDGKKLSYLSGFVPEEQLQPVLDASHQEGWAILYEDAERNDTAVPTKLKIPKPFRMAQQIFDFIGVLPGYNETDVSVLVLIFLSLFCGMIVGDAGYGLLFTIISVFIYFKMPIGKNREVMLLLTVMSASILAFGWLTGNWFGIDKQYVPVFMRGIPWFRDDANGDHLKLFCFFLGAFHLSLGRVWGAVISKNIRGVLGNLGWGSFLWGNYFTVKMLIVSGGDLPQIAKIFYIVGAILIVAFDINWKDAVSLVYSPFNFINSLVDVLSYIRLYAVGLASLYIASNFNSMSKLVWDISPWCIPFAILVILFGHLLNIASAAMGVLVHGIRLNTLEFSGQLDLSWSGKPYKAFGIGKKSAHN
ncbi:MAG: hypothetical protein WCS73_13265 [Lentisphaeria bacterium]